MSVAINTNKINNILFFNPTTIKDNSYKNSKYNFLLENPGDFTILPNEEDNEKKRLSLFKKFRDELYKEIRSSKKFCDGLQAAYVKESLKKCDVILRIESSQTRSKKINGFATLNFLRSSKSLYIDVICTNTDIKGTGSYMIKLLTKLCGDISIEHIKLSSATQAIPFYIKTDFECDPLCKMIKNINGGSGGSKTRRNKIKSHSKTNRVI
jgi:hypothetical protein